ncbi:sulfotransferase [Rhodanobacter sp. Soil772]|uniref:sulfotransferase n=1 Tax=Rhodanobacter sp. Soil772 TaxID=1736406 RepID=UPI000B10B83D|nr:sulfotransferase [Rhodanobacter sp. Soil772]
MPSLIGRLKRRLRAQSLRPSTTPQMPAEPIQQPLDDHLDPTRTCRRIAGQGLFVIGAARTGTTILQNALNDTDDIFLFGEPGFHRDPGSADFAARYNGMHRAWGNQKNKSSHCPHLFETDACWWIYLARLADLYRHVGSKIVINPEHAVAECGQLYDFHCRYFYASHYIFAFRNPLDVLLSTRGLAQLNGGRVASHVEVLRGFFSIVQLYFRTLRNLPHVHAVFHEAIDTGVFDALQKALTVPLTRAMGYYDRDKIRHYTLEQIPQIHRALTAEAMALYEDLRREALAGFGLLQIEQNDGHLDPVHFTALGRLSWRVTRFLDTLADRGD